MASIRELQHLAAALAHEVRNPLNSMAIHLDLLEGRLKKEGVVLSEASAKSLRVLVQEVERIDKILEEYLGCVGVDEGPRTASDAEAFLAGIAARQGALAASRRVRVSLQHPQPLGSWFIDVDGLAEALSALLERAISVSGEGQEVELLARTRDDLAELVIRDRGAALPDAELGRLFHIGFVHGEGRSIGLAVAKQVIKGHGGSISARRPAEGPGTEVQVRFSIEPEG